MAYIYVSRTNKKMYPSDIAKNQTRGRRTEWRLISRPYNPKLLQYNCPFDGLSSTSTNFKNLS